MLDYGYPLPIKIGRPRIEVYDRLIVDYIKQGLGPRYILAAIAERGGSISRSTIYSRICELRNQSVQ